MILYLIGLALVALWINIPFSTVISIFIIILWFSYIYLAIKNSTILLAREKRIAHICLFCLAGLALSTVRSFKEVLTLLVLMASRGDIAILVWFKAGKSFFATALAHTALAMIGLMVIYLTTDLVQSRSERHISKALLFLLSLFKKWLLPFKRIMRERHLKNSFKEIQEVIQFITELYQSIRKSYKSGLSRWIERKKLFWIFLIYLLPIPLPYLPTIIIITVRCRNIRHGLWPLLIASFIKGFIFTWLVWQGLIHL